MGKVQKIIQPGGCFANLQGVTTLFCIFLISMFTGLTGCSKSTKTAQKGYVTSCDLPEEQANSIQGKWDLIPIKLTVHDGDFDSNETGAISGAVSTWNAFFSASKNTSVFEEAGKTALNLSNPQCSGSTIADGTILYKRRSSWTRSSSAVAVTTFCTSASTSGSFPRIYNAIMEFNFRDFWGGTSGRTPDMQSIALHELGHLLGLDHSCGTLRTGLSNAACPEQGTGHWLLETVMFPSVLFDPNNGAGEFKRDLHANDQGRANCIY